MSAFEHELTEKIRHLSGDQQRKEWEFVRNLEPSPQLITYSARQLMMLPPEERDRLVQAALELASNEDFETFEACSS